MRFLVFSDIHGNLEALRAVLAHSSRKRRDAILFLGDVVGYGASPNQVIEKLRDLKSPLVSVRGNHDRVALQPKEGAIYFNAHARQAVAWTGKVLTPASRRFLQTLPVGPRTAGDGVLVCHGSPSDEDDYLFSEIEAREGFAATEAMVSFFGHSHVPCMFELCPAPEVESLVGVLLRGSRVAVDLDPNRRYLINPGSVGQPRDRDPRAAYALYDTTLHRVTLYRVPYDVEKAQRRIRSAGLPAVLADRLEIGA